MNSILDEFFKKYNLSESRSDDSVIYNDNLKKWDKLKILIKRLGGKEEEKSGYWFTYKFDLPEGYCLQFQGNKTSIFSETNRGFYWSEYAFNLRLTDSEEKYEEYNSKYGVPVEVSKAAIKIINKVEEFYNKIPEDITTKKKLSVQDKYRVQHGYGKEELIKAGVASEKDLSRFIITLSNSSSNYDSWDDDTATFGFDNTITFKDKSTGVIYKYETPITVIADAGGWYSPGDSWGYGCEPPDGESWLEGVRSVEMDDEPYLIINDDPDIDVEDISDKETVKWLSHIVKEYLSSDAYVNYVDKDLEGITGCEVR